MATLARCEFDATDEQGNLLANVSVRVRREGGGLVQLYAAREGPIHHVNGAVAYSHPSIAAIGIEIATKVSPISPSLARISIRQG